MADQTVVDLGKFMKERYPGKYDHIPDAELGREKKQLGRGKYDHFADVTSTPPASGSGMTFKQSVSQAADTAMEPLRAVDNAVAGIGASFFEIPVGAYKLARQIPGADKVLPKPNAYVEGLTQAPPGWAGSIGKIAGETAQFLAPTPAGKLKTGSRIAKLGYEGVKMAQAGVTGALQTGDLKAGAATAAVAGVSNGIGKLWEMAEQHVPQVRELAGHIYESFLVPTQPSQVAQVNKARGADAAKELIKRGQIAINKIQFAKKSTKMADKAYSEAKAVVDSYASDPNPLTKTLSIAGKQFPVTAPPGQFPMIPVQIKMQEAIRDRFLSKYGGQIPSVERDLYKDYQKILKDLVAKGDYAPVEQIHALRQGFDKHVGPKGYQAALPRQTRATADEAAKAGANAIRSVMNDWMPEIQKPNQEYRLWAAARDVLHDKSLQRVGKFGTLAKLGTAGTLGVADYALTKTGHPDLGNAAAGLIVLGGLKGFADLGATRTVSAVALGKLADALEQGNFSEGLRALSLAGLETKRQIQSPSPPKSRSEQTTAPPATRAPVLNQ